MILALFLHSVFATVFAYGLAHLFGAMSVPIAVFSLLLGGVTGWTHARRLLKAHPDWRLAAFSSGESGVMEIVLGVFVLYAGFRHFAWMLFPMDHQWSTMSLNNYGDLALHINYIRAFADGAVFPPKNAIFASELLRYPYGSDLYNALWEAVGVRLQAHLLAVGFAATVMSVILLRSFASWWGIGAFFLSGGLAGWEVMSGAPLANFQQAVEWKNLFLAVFITQRGMLFALPIGLILLIAHRRHLNEKLDNKQLTTLGILWGFLPLFHLHAFVILSLLLACQSIELHGLRGLRGFFLSRMAVVAYFPATLLIMHSTNWLHSGAVAHWNWGWAAKSGEGVGFIIRNFGAWIFVPFLIAASLFFSKDLFEKPVRRRLWIELGTYTFLFLLFYNWILAPWEWDNIKLLIWPYLGFARLLWVVLEPRMGSLLGFIERPIVALPLFFSGFVAISWTLQTPATRAVQLFSIGTLGNAEGALSDISKSAVFASAQGHLHPLAYFGRYRAVGYAGHLWSHGIDSKAAQEKIDRIMKGDPEFAKLARELGVTHIYWGPDERAQYGEAKTLWMETLPNLSRVPGHEVYPVR